MHAGRTVLLSSHILAEVEALCERVSIIRQGRIVESGTSAEWVAAHHDLGGLAARRTRWPGWPASTTCRSTGVQVRCQVDNDALDEVLLR